LPGLLAERLSMTMQDELAAMSGDHVHAVALFRGAARP
jgi:hypothetical protein